MSIRTLPVWWAMIKAEREICGDPPLEPDQIVLSYMGCGASCNVSVKDLDDVCGALDTIESDTDE
jgi:hypothetical protein